MKTRCPAWPLCCTATGSRPTLSVAQMWNYVKAQYGFLLQGNYMNNWYTGIINGGD